MTGTSAWSMARNVLAVRLDSLGDVLMTTPALRAMRESAPGRRLTLLTSPSGAAAAWHVPEVDEVITLDAPWVRNDQLHGSVATLRCLAAIESRRFDAAVIFTVYSQSALPAATLLMLAGVPLTLAHARENPYRLLSDWVGETEPQDGIRHEVRRQLDLVATVGWRTGNERLSFTCHPADVDATRMKLATAGIDPARGYVVVHPGATAASRRYPPGQFGRTAQLIAERTGHAIVVTGGRSESTLVGTVQGSLERGRGAAFAGTLTLGELGAVIDGAKVLVTNNSGPAHVAAAVGTPVVDLYALTNPQHTPWHVLSRVLFHDVPCRFCQRSVCPEGHHDCLRKVTPEQVAEAAIELVELARARHHNVRRLHATARVVPLHRTAQINAT